MIDYPEQGRMINGAYYAAELRRLRQEIERKRRRKLTRGVLLLQDNAPAHTSHVVMTAATECGFEVLPHPPYFPDMAPSPKIEIQPSWSNEGVIAAVNGYLEYQEKDFYLEGINKLEQ